MVRGGDGHYAVVAVLMQRTFGVTAARILAALVMWTAFASVFSLLLSYSRAPYAAALDGNYFRVFARLHPRHGFPYVSLLALGVVAAAFCFFDLSHVIAALVTIRIILQYVLQQVGVILLRIRHPEIPRLFPPMALSAAAAGSACRFSLHPVLAAGCFAGVHLCGRDRHYRQRSLLYAGIQTA